MLMMLMISTEGGVEPITDKKLNHEHPISGGRVSELLNAGGMHA